jgi:hypothetical protein
MAGESIPAENTCWALKGYGPSTHAVVSGTVLRKMQLRVTYRWRSGEPGSATLKDFYACFEPCAHQHPDAGSTAVLSALRRWGHGTGGARG